MPCPPYPDTSRMAYNVDRQPGAWVLAQARQRQRLVWFMLTGLFLLLGLYFALVLGHRLSIAGVALVVALFLAVKPRVEGSVERMLRWLRGARAEQSVGETVNALRRDGWIVMHDIEQAGEGNIDHLASGTNGVYLIETKQRRYLDLDLTKAKRQAAKLHDELGVWVTPLVCLHERRDPPRRTHGVWVVPQRHLLDWLREQRNQSVAFERLARWAGGITDECC